MWPSASGSSSWPSSSVRRSSARGLKMRRWRRERLGNERRARAAVGLAPSQDRLALALRRKARAVDRLVDARRLLQPLRLVVLRDHADPAPARALVAPRG